MAKVCKIMEENPSQDANTLFAVLLKRKKGLDLRLLGLNRVDFNQT